MNKDNKQYKDKLAHYEKQEQEFRKYKKALFEKGENPINAVISEFEKTEGLESE